MGDFKKIITGLWGRRGGEVLGRKPGWQTHPSCSHSAGPNAEATLNHRGWQRSGCMPRRIEGVGLGGHECSVPHVPEFKEMKIGTGFTVFRNLPLQGTRGLVCVGLACLAYGLYSAPSWPHRVAGGAGHLTVQGRGVDPTGPGVWSVSRSGSHGTLNPSQCPSGWPLGKCWPSSMALERLSNSEQELGAGDWAGVGWEGRDVFPLSMMGLSPGSLSSRLALTIKLILG